MKQFSNMETQHDLSKVFREGAETVKFPDFAARARETWGKPWKGASSDEVLDESRGDR